MVTKRKPQNKECQVKPARLDFKSVQEFFESVSTAIANIKYSDGRTLLEVEGPEKVDLLASASLDSIVLVTASVWLKQ
jgi:hypothetical protein